MNIPDAFVYEPRVEVSGSEIPELNDKKIGQTIQAIVNYEVIEKTKSYVILKLNHVYVMFSKRVF